VDSVTVVLDDGGKIVTQHEYLPFGETWITEGDKKNAPKYNSQELDRETNFYYYNARHYDPEIGRFVTPDTVIDGELSTQGWNRFAYVKNNPIMYKDPTGHWTDPVEYPEVRSHLSDNQNPKGNMFGEGPSNIYGPSTDNKSRGHGAIDLRTIIGEKVKAVGDGKVVFSGKMNGYGNTVVLEFVYKYTEANKKEDIVNHVSQEIIKQKEEMSGHKFYALYAHLKQIQHNSIIRAT
jgi:RHS repeat-associated protein